MPRIRHADPRRDAAACAAIYAPSVTSSPASFEETAPTAEEMATRIEQISSKWPWLVAEDQDRVVGFAYAATHRERAAYRWACEVTVYVGPEHRRRGVGRRLYETLFALLTRQGIQVALAGITLPNDSSVSLHEGLGFEPIGVYRRIGWKAGGWRDVGWWALELIPAGTGRPPEPGPPARLQN